MTTEQKIIRAKVGLLELAKQLGNRRFTDILTDVRARLGADVVRYSFIVSDLHRLLLAGLPAH